MRFKTLMNSLIKLCGIMQTTAIDLSSPTIIGNQYRYTAPADGYLALNLASDGYYIQRSGTVMCEAHFCTTGNTGCTVPVKKGETLVVDVGNYTVGNRLYVKFFKLYNSP